MTIEALQDVSAVSFHGFNAHPESNSNVRTRHQDFTRQVVIRKVCFKNDATDRIGFYLGRIKDITASMQRQLDAGVEQSKVAKSRRDDERITNAHRDNETHIFDRAWKVHAPHWLQPVTT